MVTLNDIIAAQARLAGYVRHTPLFKASALRQQREAVGDLTLKLENLQVTGSFKARGAVNKTLSLSPEQVARGIVTASGGNHGLGVAYAGWLTRTRVIIYLSQNSPLEKAQRLRSWGAEVIFAGQVWDEANQAALETVESTGMTYIHPFADEVVIAGQGTIGLEIVEDEPAIETVLLAIGGGGLISGVSTAIKALNPAVKIIGVEPVGAPTLYESVRSGRVIELPAIRTVANTLAPRQSTALNLEIIQRNVDAIVLVTDDEMREAAHWLWSELGIGAELSGAAAVAALLTGKAGVDPAQKTCALVCGTGSDGIA